MERAKCPICGGEAYWIGELKLKKTKECFLVWGCPLLDDEHWEKGHIFLSDLKLNSFSMEESDKIRDRIRDEELSVWEELE